MSVKSVISMFDMLEEVMFDKTPDSVRQIQQIIDSMPSRHETIVMWRKPPSLDEAQAYVAEGNSGTATVAKIDAEAPAGDPIQILVHEEGMYLPMSPNHAASALGGTSIVGPAIILSGDARWTS